MRLLSTISRFSHRALSKLQGRKAPAAPGPRLCRVEAMEPRLALAGDLHFGGVYFEGDLGADVEADVLQITFEGGAAGTKVTRLVIDGDKDGHGLSAGDLFFDTAPGGLGAFASRPLSIIAHDGFTVLATSVVDGGSLLTIDVSGFDPGEKLVLSTDVDELQFVDPTSGQRDTNAIVEGAEFQRAKLTATFTAPQYFDITGTATYFDTYDNNFAALDQSSGSQLNLPPDRNSASEDQSDRTAGGAAVLKQVPLPITLAGTVFEDVNLNNQQNQGDPGISGVSLTLRQFNGTQYVNTGKTATTNSAGNYKFEGLLAGKYQVVETQPSGYVSVGAKAGTVGGQTRGTVLSPDVLSEIELVGGDDSVDNDFAEARLASLAGNVYHDRNNNGQRQAGEEGIAGVTVRVIPVTTVGTPAGSVDVQTRADGSWSVGGLNPGTYRVVEVNQPSPYIDGLDAAGNAGGTATNPGDQINGISLASGQSGVEYNFGELLPSRISGRVHADEDGDCEFDPGETLLAGVTIRLRDANGQQIATATTNSQGVYEFTLLRPGSYTVFEEQPTAYFDGEEHVGSAGGRIAANDTIGSIVLVSGTNAVDYNFCENVLLELGGHVYADDDNDGVLDPGEAGIGGVRLRLLDANGNPTGATTTTAADGSYRFLNVRPGTYGVAEDQPSAFLDGLDTPGNRGGTAQNPGDRITGAVLQINANGENYNFGELRPASIAGRVHADLDGDCEFDAGEQPLSGVRIHVLDANGNILQTRETDASGRYRFDNLRPDTYGVREEQPAGYFDSEEHAGTAGGQVVANDRIGGIVLQTGRHGEDYDFCEIPPTSISGFVYHDRDDDGVRDSGEEGIGGVELRLLGANGQPTGITARTGSNGSYRFDNLQPGVYGVAEEQPSGYYDGLDTPGTSGGHAENPGDRITGADLKPAVEGRNYNFGELAPAGLRGFVFADLDGDCEQDANEVGIAGVTVRLLNKDGQTIATTSTDAQGRYEFTNLQPGEYGIFEEQPAGYFDSGEEAGNAGGVVSANDKITGIRLGAGQSASGYHFCEVPPTSISGFVYHDRDNDGLRESGEEGIGGVELQLLGPSGQPTGAKTTTAADGSYRFDKLQPGIYGVSEAQPTGYFDGLDAAGTSGGSAVNPGDRITEADLKPAVEGRNYNFGELAPAGLRGLVFADLDGDCDVDENEVGVAGVTVRLLNKNGETIATTTTNTQGRYEFLDLPPAEYGIFEEQPAGYFDGGEDVGNAGGVVSANDKITGIEVAAAQSASGYHFCEVPPTSISGFVYHDRDNDGVREAGEEGIGGGELQLLGADGQPTGAKVTTAADGSYRFGNLQPGVYGVSEAQPSGYYDGLDAAGTAGGSAVNPGDRIAGADLKPAVEGRNYNFGELGPVSISGFVYHDRDNDGVREAGEEGIGSAELQLLGADGQPTGAKATTAADGSYRFGNLQPGVYGVSEAQPTSYFDGSDAAGSAGGAAQNPGDRITGAQLRPTVDGRDYNFGELRPATISGYVFIDGAPIPVTAGSAPPDVSLIKNGRLTSDDRRLRDVVVTLTDGNGIPVLGSASLSNRYPADAPILARTDANGYFEFVGLRPGVYSILEVHPGQYFDSLDTPGPRGGTAINPNFAPPADIPLELINIARNDGILRINAPSGTSASDNWFSEVELVERPDLPKIPVPPPPFNPPFFPPVGTLPPPTRLASLVPPPFVVQEPLFTRGAGAEYTWHLSVVNAGQPRGEGAPWSTFRLAVTMADGDFGRVRLDEGTFLLSDNMRSTAPSMPRSVPFGAIGGVPVVGDFNGDGITDLGVYKEGEWFIDLNGNGRWDEADLWAKLGTKHDRPVTGDWDGDGKTDIGIFGPAWPGDDRAIAAEPGIPDPNNEQHDVQKNPPPEEQDAAIGLRRLKLTSRGDLRGDLIDHVFRYGWKNDIPVVGDWNGDGVDTIAIFRAGRWYRDTDADGKWTDKDLAATFGRAGDIPVVGDFNGDGVDEIGVFRDGVFYLDTNGNGQLDDGDARIALGRAGDVPVTGDWDGDGVDEPGVYREGVRMTRAENK